MKVKCTWNYMRENELTVGKEYEVIEETHSMIKIFNDKKQLMTTLKERFEKWNNKKINN